MRRSLSHPLALVIVLAASAAAQGSPKIPSGPWKDIFNGRNLEGWASVGNPPWSISNGILQTKGGATKTYLIWNEPLKDLELEVKYRLSTGNANSGIQVRSNCADKSKTPPSCGGTHQVCGVQLDVAMSYSGRLFEECVGFLQFDGQGIDDCRRTLAVGQWMTTTARFDGAKVSVWLNGTHCLDYTLTNAEHLNGSIFALQSHPPFDLIEWEKVRIRKLNVPGCTDPKATNHDPEATLDDGSCVLPVGLARSMERRAPGARVVRSGVEYSVPGRGPYRLRLLDVEGAVVAEAAGLGPAESGRLELPGPGIYFLESESAGFRSRSRLLHF
jgi:hypothetical protein